MGGRIVLAAPRSKLPRKLRISQEVDGTFAGAFILDFHEHAAQRLHDGIERNSAGFLMSGVAADGRAKKGERLERASNRAVECMREDVAERLGWGIRNV